MFASKYNKPASFKNVNKEHLEWVAESRKFLESIPSRRASGCASQPFSAFEKLGRANLLDRLRQDELQSHKLV